MIDIHCHVLPGMDDGPETLTEAVEMCRIAAADGTHTIVATPHFSPDSHSWSARDLGERIDRLQAALRAENVGLIVLPGAEAAIFPELAQALADGTVMTMNGRGRSVLTEFPFASAPPHWESFLRKILDAGTVPIIAHPERNAWFLRHPEAIYSIVREGGLIQLTAMSVLGGFGEEAREFSMFLLRHKLAHALATDAHSAGVRPPKLAEAARVAASVIGEERARELVTTVPAAIIEGRAVRAPEPEPPAGKQEAWIKRAVRAIART